MTKPTNRRPKGGFRKAPKPGEPVGKSAFRLDLDQKWRDACRSEGADDRPSGAGDHSA
jgi:hypothetical protein